ncbi:helix-turn-helix domain-containing protein [Novosphingobium sp. BL-8A]
MGNNHTHAARELGLSRVGLPRRWTGWACD